MPLPVLAGLGLSFLAGCFTPPTMTVSPASWDFGTVADGSEVSQTITITNTSGFALQIVEGTNEVSHPQLAVTGLPIVNLEPGHSARFELVFRPNSNSTGSVIATLDLEFGGYAGSNFGDSASDIFLDVSGNVTSVVVPVCKPGPDGDSNGFGGIGPAASYQWSQASYACTSEEGSNGTSCQSPSDCSAFCCSCPSDCAGFTAQACIDGSCARAPVACDLTSAGARGSGPILCPDGGHASSTVLGALGFAVGGSGVAPSSTLTLTLSRDASSACLGAGAAPGLSFLLGPGSESTLVGGLFQIGPGGGSALLDDPNAGPLTATAGYVMLTELSDAGVAGSFDVQFPGGSNGEVWGAIDAPVCP